MKQLYKSFLLFCLCAPQTTKPMQEEEQALVNTGAVVVVCTLSAVVGIVAHKFFKAQQAAEQDTGPLFFHEETQRYYVDSTRVRLPENTIPPHNDFNHYNENRRCEDCGNFLYVDDQWSKFKCYNSAKQEYLFHTRCLETRSVPSGKGKSLRLPCPVEKGVHIHILQRDEDGKLVQRSIEPRTVKN